VISVSGTVEKKISGRADLTSCGALGGSKSNPVHKEKEIASYSLGSTERSVDITKFRRGKAAKSRKGGR